MTEPQHDPGPPQPHMFPAPPPWPVPAHKKKRPIPTPIAVLIGAAPALLFGLCMGAAVGGSNSAEPETITVTVDPNEARELDLNEREGELDEREEALDKREDEITEAEIAIEEGTIPGNGVYVVGEDIQPGVYRALGDGDSCYWARLGSLAGDDIITNDFGSANVTVEIYESDAAFETTGCGEWRLR